MRMGTARQTQQKETEQSDTSEVDREIPNLMSMFLSGVGKGKKKLGWEMAQWVKHLLLNKES